MNKNIHIIDCTLREGNQAHGVSFNTKTAVEIAKGIASLNIDILEVGHPVCSAEEMERVKAIVSLNLSCSIMAHSRALEKDVQAVYQSGASWIGIFAGVNEYSRKTRIVNRTTDEILLRVQNSVQLAKKLGLRVRYTIEDASRTDMDLLVHTYRMAVQAGADRICYSDTVGVLEPKDVTENIAYLREKFPNVDIEVHFHDDRGLALSNSLAAIDAGANWISSSVNGLGERSGITDTSVILANLAYRKTQIKTDLKDLKKISRLVAMHSRGYVDSRRPITGRHAFHHKAKLHINAINIDETAYSWIPANLFGTQTTHSHPELPQQHNMLINNHPKVISSSELRHHTDGPGNRYVMIDERFIPDCRQYCIVRDVQAIEKIDYTIGHVEPHRHDCDSLFMFIGKDEFLKGLTVQVQLENESFTVSSPASVFIPAGVNHSYKFISGSGIYINHVLSGTYNESLHD